MNCIDCKFFNRFAAPIEHLGACAVELPPWLMQHVEAEMCVSRTVRVDDGCALHAPCMRPRRRNE